MHGGINSLVRPLGCAAGLAILAGVAAAQSGPTAFTGVDPEAEPAGPFSGRPNCDAADLAWTAAASALGPISRVTFESETPEDNLVSRFFNPGVIISGGTFHIRGNLGSATEGFNITPGGSKYLKPDAYTTDGSPVVYTFAFDVPAQAFSFYLTGVGNRFGGRMDMTFDDGASQSIPLTNLYLLGGAQFAGFTDAGRAVSSVSLSLADSPNGINAARMAIDEVRWVTVPAPGAVGVLALAGAAVLRRRRS